MTESGAGRDRSARKAWQAMADLVLNNERRREVSEEVGLSFGKIRALRRIARRPMSMSELASMLSVDPPNLTAVVDDLEGAGLVERQAHATDRRVKLVVASPEGAALGTQGRRDPGASPSQSLHAPGRRSREPGADSGEAARGPDSRLLISAASCSPVGPDASGAPQGHPD